MSVAEIDAIHRDIERHDDQIEKIWDAIEKLRNRLPLWATFAFSLLTFTIGCLLTWIRMAGP